jgi:outer membrane receptor protein involved in Fe transport
MEYDFRLKISSLIALIAVVFCASFALGQGIVTGSISGTVLDPQGAVVNGAKITATQTSTNRKFDAVTAGSGNFSLRSIPIGSYDVKVEATNYRAYESKGLVVNTGSDTSVGAVKLEVGATSETVTVEGTAPLIESTTQQITNTFDSQKAQDLPVGNTLDSLALFAPGVATAGDASFSNNNGAEIAVNGQRARSNNYQIDGQNNNDNSVGGPSIFFGHQEAIAELQVVTNYSAEYGRNMGAVVNYVTKSGTNQFHGTGYEFYQGSHFDSLANQSKSPVFGYCVGGADPTTTGCLPIVRPNFVDNRFGGTVGGPIKKDKIWFFGSANFERQRFGQTPSNSGGSLLPSANGLAQLQAAFPGNAAVAAYSNIGPLAVKAGNPTFSNLTTELVTATPGVDCTATPGSCVPIEFGTVNRFAPSLFNDYEGTGRVDVKVTNKDNVFGRYVFQQNISTVVAGGNGVAVGDYVDVPGRDQQIGLDWSRNWTNNFVNQARFSYSRANFGFQGGAFPNCLQLSINNCPTNISFADNTANFGLSTNLPQGRIINVYQVQDNASLQAGKHTIKMGGEWSKQRSPNIFLPDTNGQYSYTDFSSYLSGSPTVDTFAAGNANLRFKENDLAFYVQDDWRIKDNLTLNLGLRWEWFQQAVNLLHDLTVAQQTGGNPFWDPTLPLNRTTVPRIPQDLNNFSPVVGFAWTPRVMRKYLGEDKTVIRGGFRIGYDPSFYNIFLNTATAAPVVNLNSFVGPGVPASGIGTDVVAQLGPLNPTGGDPGLRKQVTVGPTFHNPYTEQWNLGIQRSFGQRIVAEVRYVGNHDIGNFQNVNANPELDQLTAYGFSSFIPAGVTACTDATAPGFGAFPDCTRTRVQQRQNSAWSNYNGLQTEMRMANWHGLTSTVSYTWSKTLDNASEVYSNIAGGTTTSYAQNPFDISKGEKSVSGIDFRNIVGVTFIYDLPFYKNQQGFLGKVLGGWQMNTTYRYTPGQPYSTVQLFPAYVTGLPSLCDSSFTMSTAYDPCRPVLTSTSAPLNTVGLCTDPTASNCGVVDYVTGAPTTLSAVHWLVNDPTAATFYKNPFNGARRNSYLGQPISTANLSFFKNTKLTERFTLQLRATAYNILNTQFRGVPDPLLEDVFGGFGPAGQSAGQPGFLPQFQSTAFNANGGDTFAGNINTDGIGIRRLELGAKIIF